MQFFLKKILKSTLFHFHIFFPTAFLDTSTLHSPKASKLLDILCLSPREKKLTALIIRPFVPLIVMRCVQKWATTNYYISSNHQFIKHTIILCTTIKEMLAIKLWYTTLWKMHPNVKMNKLGRCTPLKQWNTEYARHCARDPLIPGVQKGKKSVPLCCGNHQIGEAGETKNVSWPCRMVFIITEMKTKQVF